NPAEHGRLSELLGTDFKNLGFNGVWMNKPKWSCTSCGKEAGFEDFVATALADGIHTQQFLLEVLRRPKLVETPPAHYSSCANCG
ncbi:hypothetical protein BDZ91DRAFT_617343, partial [Kalaharituber pfeilii]